MKFAESQRASSRVAASGAAPPNAKFGAAAEPTFTLNAQTPYLAGRGSLAIQANTSGNSTFFSVVIWDAAKNIIIDDVRWLETAPNSGHHLAVVLQRKAARMYWIRCEFSKDPSEPPLQVSVDDGQGHPLGIDKTLSAGGPVDAVTSNGTQKGDTTTAYFRFKSGLNFSILGCSVAAYQLAR